ncbi:MAG TPA: hypothetical protein VHF45_05295 [Thermoleophilaceae bacterium]|nr:hypothetical protein [Thermoleophilaceae bacterium]
MAAFARGEWCGDTRHIHEIAVLRDVSIATRPAYEDAVVEYRTQPDPAEAEEETMPEEATATPPNEESDETRAEERPPAGSLHVEERHEGAAPRSLTDKYRSRGFPGQRAELEWDEFRSVTWSGSVTDLNPTRRQGAELAYDRRYAWPAMVQQGVDSGTTAVDVVRQTARALPAAADVIRTIAETTTKPEAGSTLALVSTR